MKTTKSTMSNKPKHPVETFASVWDALVNITTAMGREVQFELRCEW